MLRTGPLAAQMPVGLFRAARGLTAPGELQDRTPKMELPATAALWASPTGPEQGPRSRREVSLPTEGSLSGKGAGCRHKTQKAVPGATVEAPVTRLTVHPKAGGRTPHDPSCGSNALPKPRGAPTTATTTMFTATSTPRTPGRMAQAGITPGCDTPAWGTTGTGMIAAVILRLDGPAPVAAEL